MGSLYERLGGSESITAVVEDFRDRVAKDSRINQKFAKTDLVRLRQMLIDQVCEATGGPCKYTGRTMKEAHAGMKVTSGEFDALVQDLVATFNHFKVGKAEQCEVLGVLGGSSRELRHDRSGGARRGAGRRGSQQKAPVRRGVHVADQRAHVFDARNLQVRVRPPSGHGGLDQGHIVAGPTADGVSDA